LNPPRFLQVELQKTTQNRPAGLKFDTLFYLWLRWLVSNVEVVFQALMARRCGMARAAATGLGEFGSNMTKWKIYHE